MKINTKTRYGIRAMLELALNYNKDSTFQKDIAKNQDISYKYLDQIISALKSANLISTIAGKKSGYVITKNPKEISMYDIYKSFNPELNIIECQTGSEECKREKYCAAKGFWDGLNSQVINYLKSTSLHDLVIEQVSLNKQNNELMFHI